MDKKGFTRNEVRDIVEKLNSFANWHTSCNGGNVSEEAQMCMDAVDEIRRLRSLRGAGQTHQSNLD